MADHTVRLTYDKDPVTSRPKVTVTPFLIRVRPGDTIRFQRAGQLQGSMRVTFKDKGFFATSNPQFAATGKFLEGDGDVRVNAKPTPTTYRCELLDANGNSIAQSEENQGGAIEPEVG